MPVAGEAGTATKAALGAEGVDRCGLLPEGTFWSHDLRDGFRKSHFRQMLGGIADHCARLVGLTGGTRTELQHDRGRDVAGAGGEGFVVDEQQRVFDTRNSGQAAFLERTPPGYTDFACCVGR